ncbi:AbrB family transcriptional regulator [Mycolicibacterium farcinogenes]|uniref:AbrB family transcriptional regulator n=1 Tax=Mycolicibacterium farcinogenes TaxID=1802 RepID=UPI001C8EED79|nr:AbrB family transcriptional regulator [Mycolicibacterium farcinogenes]QZH60920.1 AbrB family transcriptional regulator [Mycolicibacterium farcinogenes]
MLRWLLLILLTAAAAAALDKVGVPSATLFAALVVGIGLAMLSVAPQLVPRKLSLVAQGILGVHIGTMVSSESLAALDADWPIVLGVAIATLVLSLLAGLLLGIHRDISLVTGALALVAGGAAGLIAVARDLGGDDRVVAVVQFLRIGLVTASMPLVVTFIYHAERQPSRIEPAVIEVMPWYISMPLLAVIVAIGAATGKVLRVPGGLLLGPMAVTMALELTGHSFGLWVPLVLVEVSYAVLGWQAGLNFTPESLHAVGRALPTAIVLIATLTVVTAGLGVLLAEVTGMTALEGYLATSPGGIYAVLATAVETGSDTAFIIAAQVLRVLLMLFGAPLFVRAIRWFGQRFGRNASD